MKKTVFLMALLGTVLCAGAAELLPNPAFRENFKNWTRRGAVSGLKTDGASAVFSGNKEILLIQYNLPVKPGKYVVNYRVSGNGNYQVYCEVGGKSADGKKFYRSSGSRRFTAPVKEETRRFDFTIEEEDLPAIRSFALVFCYLNGQEIRFSSPSLQLDNAAAAPEVRQKGEWRFSGGSHFTDGVLKQINNSGSNLPRTRWYPDSVKPGKSYRFSCRTHGKRTTDKSGFCNFQILPIIDGKEVGGTSWDDTFISDTQRKRIEFTVPAQAKKVGMDFVSGAKSEVWFSDMKLEEIPPVKKVSTIELLSPGYRDSVYSSMPVKEIAGILRFEGGAVSADVTLFCGKKQIARRHSTGNFAFPSPGKDCTVRAELLDKGGKKLGVIEKSVRFLPPARNEVVIGQDRKIYINGKAFFPIAMTELPAVHEPDGCYFAARHGINLTTLSQRYVHRPEEVLAVLDRAQKAGLYVILYVQPRINDLTRENMAEYKKKLREFFPPQIVNHPAFFGYFVTDEPLWVGVPLARVQLACEIFREFDPYHPIWINEAPRNSVEAQRNYAKYSDICSIDIYPFPYPNSHSHLKDKSLTCIGKYADFLHEVVEHRKPVEMVLQAFSWHAYYYLDDGTGYPSLTHTRFVCFDSLFHNAIPKLWGTRHIRSAAFYDIVFQVTQELHQLSGLFACGKKTEILRTSHPDVIAEIYEAEGHQYLAIRNASEKPLIAEIYGNYPAMKRLLPQGVKQDFAPRRDQIALEAFETVFFGTAPLPAPAYSLPARNAALEKGDNPYKRIIKADFGRRKYEGKANWIWDGRDTGAYSKAEVKKEFALDLLRTAKVSVRAAIDDKGEVFFNGQSIMKCEGFGCMSQKEVPAAMLKEHNTLTIRGEDGGCVPCGILAEITITGKDGKTQTLVSDGSWKCPDGRPVQIIVPFGKGAWGNRVLVQELFE